MSSPPAGLNQSSSSSLPQQRASVAGSRTSLNPSYTSLALSLSQTSLLIPESSSRSQVLPKDHYHLRFASSYVINLITPTLRTVHFSRSERNIDLKRITEERLALLSRMERTWGTSWADAASDLLNGSESAQSLEVKEAKLRACNITATAKARERKVFVSAMRDGILFCFLFNRLFPSQPASIQRVKVPKDDVRVAANISRFLDACREIGVGESDMFCLEDLDENSPVGLARVSRTILILANMAPPAQAPPKHRSSRSGLRPISGATDASSSAPSSKNASRPESPRYQTTATRGLRERPLRSSSSDLHARLQKEGTSSNTSTIGTASSNSMGPAAAAAAVPAVPPVPDSSKGPTSPLSHFSHSSYSATPPLSPVRPSATSTASQRTSGSGSHTPSSSRPQRIASSKTQVSFKSDGGSPHVSGQDWSSSFSSNHSTTHLAPLHVRERTPSLVSNNSQIASSYSRSSVRGSEPTILNDDSQPVDEFERHIEGAAAHTSLNEGPRRISEQTLQEARRKIIGTLLSSTDDLHRGSSLEEARGFALSQSLAALEGSGKRADSPRLRPGPLSRSTTSQGNETPQDGSTTAEDGNGSSDPSPPARPLSELPPRPRIRRSSHNGKMYVPKRTNSPASPNLSLVAGISPPVMPIPIDPAFMNGHVTSKEERRKSEDLPNGNVASSGANKIMNMRNHSMINLPATSRQTSNPSHKSIDSVVTPSLQILRFGAPGQLPTKYQLGNCIGRGQFGSVYRSLNLSTGQMVAIKRIRLSGLKEAEVSDVMREVELLQRLSHPGIVKYEGMSRDDAFLNIVLEFVENGSLGQTLRAFGKFNERLVASYVAKILEGLNYLHSEGVVHCDLKAANILSTKNGNIKLSDFGVSLNMRAVEHFAERTSIGRAAANDGMRSPNEVAGTPNWMAPEVIKLQGASPKSDIWSLGCTIVELLTGKPPYSDLGNSMTVLFRIVEDPVPPVPHSVSPELKDFLTLCFTKNPENRPSAALLFEHEWVKIGHPDLIQRPQDSLPFLRRLSHEPNHRALSSQSLFQAGKRSASASLIDLHEESRIEAEAAETRRRAQLSMVSLHSHLHQSREGLDSSAAKAHALVKTTFAKCK
jgi:serine/threonine protein kinase